MALELTGNRGSIGFRLRLWLMDRLMLLAMRLEPDHRWQHETTDDGMVAFRRQPLSSQERAEMYRRAEVFHKANRTFDDE